MGILESNTVPEEFRPSNSATYFNYFMITEDSQADKSGVTCPS